MSASSETSTVLWLAETVTFARAYPMRRKTSSMVPTGTPIEYVPSARVTAVTIVPRTLIRAPSTGSPVTACVTVPVMTLVWAVAPGAAASTNTSANKLTRIRIAPP